MEVSLIISVLLRLHIDLQIKGKAQRCISRGTIGEYAYIIKGAKS